MARIARHAALASSPAFTGTSAGLAAYRIAHNPDAAVRLAALAGILTLAVVLLLLLAQVLESWILHRSEQHFSSAIRQAVMVAIGDASSERRTAALQASERLGITRLAETTITAMRITHDHTDHAPSPALHPAHGSEPCQPRGQVERSRIVAARDRAVSPAESASLRLTSPAGGRSSPGTAAAITPRPTTRSSSQLPARPSRRRRQG
jgi:hypothetical protein